MINFSFSTVYMTIIVSNILLVLIAICFRNTKLMLNTGYKLLALFVGFTMLRFLLPIELSFTKTVILPKWISMIVSRIRHSFWEIAGFKISIWTILQVIWLIGIVILLAKNIRKYFKVRYLLLANSLDATDNKYYQSILDRICKERGKKNNFQIWIVSGVKVPMLYGIIKPRILLPEELSLSDEDLYYALAHEASHHFHHDLWMKSAISMIRIVYWWNPLCYLLKQQTDILLEMRVDNKVTLSDDKARIAYLECLLYLKEQISDTSTSTVSAGIGLFSVSDDVLVKRFEMLTSAKKRKLKMVNIAFSLLIVGLFLWSYLFIYEAGYICPEVEETTLSITYSEGNGYSVLKEDGTYDVYFYGCFIENTDSLECFPKDIKIYTEKELQNEEH